MKRIATMPTIMFVGIVITSLIVGYLYLDKTTQIIHTKQISVPWAGGNANTPCPEGYEENGGICLLKGESFDYVWGNYFSNFTTTVKIVHISVSTWTYYNANDGANDTIAHVQFTPKIGAFGCTESSLDIHKYNTNKTPLTVGQTIRVGYQSWYTQFDIKHNGALIHSQNYGCDGTGVRLIS